MISSLKTSLTTTALILLVVVLILCFVEQSDSCGGGGGGGGCGFKGKGGWKEDKGKGWKGDKGKGKGDKGKGKAKGCWKEDKGKGKCCKPKGGCGSCDDDDDDDCGGMYKEKMYKEKMWKEKSFEKGKKCCKAVASKLIAKAKKLGDDEDEASYVYAPARAPIRYQYLPAVEPHPVRYVEAPVDSVIPRRRHQVVSDYGDDYEDELHRVRAAPRYVDEPVVRAAPRSREIYDYPRAGKHHDYNLIRERDNYSGPLAGRFRDTATARGRGYPGSDYLIYGN